MKNKLKSFTVRKLQVYATACLKLYCEKISFRHDSVEQLIKHLIGMASSENLPQWEQKGSFLELNGRGDPLPEFVFSLLSENQINTLQRMVEACVEVGIVDMYGGSTELPIKFTNECLKILREEGIEEPSLDVLEFNNGNDKWGSVFEKNKLKEIEIFYEFE